MRSTVLQDGNLEKDIIGNIKKASQTFSHVQNKIWKAKLKQKLKYIEAVSWESYCTVLQCWDIGGRG
uniref:Uncharacterized protein n=1 Tax=Arion vulgaris TaxID=1028688 RepID=A0A0B7A8M6_9EUPU